MEYEYSKPCSSLPYREPLVEFLSGRMEKVGYDINFPIVIWEGTILDGRHRYNAANLSGVTPTYITFEGTQQEAWDYVSDTNVDGTRQINNSEKEFFYAQRAASLGVQERGGNGNNQHQSGNTPNGVIAPSQEDHAASLGVHINTVNRWEKARKEIMAEPELAAKAVTPEGYQEAKAEVKKRRNIVVPAYRVDEAMGAIKGISEMFSKSFEGTKGEAANVLVSELIKGCETDDIGLSIARDYVKWFMSMKEVMDIAEPELIRFMNEQPNLKIVV